MGISGQSSRPRALLLLAGLVVVFGGVSWFVTKGIGLHGAPPIHSYPATVMPGPTPTPLECPSTQLALVGAFNECAQTVHDATSTCSVSGHILEAVLRLGGSPDAFLLYIEVNGAFAGPGTSYALPPWPHAMGDGRRAKGCRPAGRHQRLLAIGERRSSPAVRHGRVVAVGRRRPNRHGQRRPVGNRVCQPRTVRGQQLNCSGCHAQRQWTVELSVTVLAIPLARRTGRAVQFVAELSRLR
jgi:hypothetical protein